MATHELPCAASSLTGALFDNEATGLVEVERTTVSVHYEIVDVTADTAPGLLCVCTPAAVRLPNSVVLAQLPGAGTATIGGGGLRVGEVRWTPRRWWAPPRPHNLPVPDSIDDLSALTGPAGSTGGLPGLTWPRPSYDGLEPGRLVGAGPGLTPAGDDVLAGALVSAHAIGDDRLVQWQRSTRAAMAVQSTTAVSRSLLHHALDGYATTELAGLLVAVCRGLDVHEPLRRLLAVGHTSGSALVQGVLHTLTTTDELQGAA